MAYEDDDATSSITEKDYVVRGVTIDKWYFFYNHGYLLWSHFKPTGTWFYDFIRYSDAFIHLNNKRLKQ